MIDEMIARYERYKYVMENLEQSPGIMSALSKLSPKDASLALLEDVITRLKELKEHGSTN